MQRTLKTSKLIGLEAQKIGFATDVIALASFIVPFVGSFGAYQHLAYPMSDWLEKFGPIEPQVHTCESINGLRAFSITDSK